MSDSSHSRARKATEAVKRGAEVTANGIYQATDFVVRNDVRIADGAQAVTGVFGSGLDKAGKGMASASQQASQLLHGNANRAAERVREVITGSAALGMKHPQSPAVGLWAAESVMSVSTVCPGGALLLSGAGWHSRKRLTSALTSDRKEKTLLSFE
jgi:hypothetical protein